MTLQISQNMAKLYEEDYLLWCDRTAEQLRNRNINDLDWQNLTEEIEDLGRSQRNAVESYLRQLLKHLLLYQYWTTQRDDCGDGWPEEIDNFRNELEILLRSQTLYNHAAAIFEATYQKARNSALKKTKLDLFPQECPYSIEQTLDLDYLPD